MEASKHADVTISIDCDGQDDISAISRMLDAYVEGAEVVYGVRSSRETDTTFKRFTAETFYKTMERLGVETIYNHADYRLLSRKVLNDLASFPEVNLYLRGLIPLVGYPSATVEYARQERLAGKSHYPLKKMLSLAFDGITSLSVKPMHLIALVGLFTSALGLLGIVWAVVVVLLGAGISGWASTICVISFFGGMQLLALGVIGEYVGKIYLETKRRPRYLIASRTWEE
jgi:glycosyltransferase involved in cell wall biosynthesis